MLLMVVLLFCFILVSEVVERFWFSVDIGFKVSILLGWVMMRLFLLMMKVKLDGVGLMLVIVCIMLLSCMFEFSMVCRVFLLLIGLVKVMISLLVVVFM